MTPSKHSEENKKMVVSKKRWLIFAVFFLVLVTVLITGVVVYEQSYAKKFYRGVKIGYLDVGGQSRQQVLGYLDSIEKNIQTKGLVFKTLEKEVVINPITITAADPDLAKPILTFDWNKTADEAWQVGRRSSWFGDLAAQAKALVSGTSVQISYNLDRAELLNALRSSLSEMEKPPVNAGLKIDGDSVAVTGEESGYLFDYDLAVDKLVNQITALNFEPIQMDLVFQEPAIKKNQTASAVNSIEKILVIDELTLAYEDQSWTVPKAEFVNWLEFQELEGEIVVGFNKDKVVEFLTPLAKDIDVPASDAKFTLEGDRVTEFQSSQDGKKLSVDASYEKINQQIIIGSALPIELVVEVDPAKVATSELNNLGIKELIGRGTSNFAGSPKNRRHNIATGAKSLDGILIAPGEEFSLLDALGEIDGENGYLQELVIKGNRTVPEYGGGLCQIGTTTFRAALYSGLPIVQRRNHSYRVVYYEPAGMDATIYDPAPDLKFLNDTGYHILFIAKMEGDTLVFEFYGTKDGRQAIIDPDPPTIYNVTSPGAPRYIETTELAPGEKKKVESAHPGADTYFKYTIIYPNGEVKEQEFKSHYVAWPEVWMVGVDPVAATTTEAVVDPGAAADVNN
ncbi:MAG: VanW family protein [Candidatus Buchananbacteria bacterium]|nr:VanW family protein [Candidatus Buchananbacteria bacterium]